MTSNRFIDQVRQYARMAQRKHTSYAEQIEMLALLRAHTIDIEITDQSAKMKALQEMSAFIHREYQPFDASFVLESYD